MKKTLLLLFLSIICVCIPASGQQKNDAWQRAETAVAEGKYKEAFDYLHDFEHAISTNNKLDSKGKAAERYKANRTRMNIYIKLRKPKNVLEQLEKMERWVNASADESIKNDFLYNKAICHYTLGQTDKGNAVFKEMVVRLTASKDYDKVNNAYQTLIEAGRKSGNASMVAQAYGSYVSWKDSTNNQKAAAERNALNKQIQAGQASITEKDSKLASRGRTITLLCTLLAALAAALTFCILLLLRYIHLTRKQKKDIRLLNEIIALKAKFTSNISAQLKPALQKLDSQQPEVKALLHFVGHIQMLSALEQDTDEVLEKEDISLPAYCEDILSQVRGKVKSDVVVNADVPKSTVSFNKEYVSHILHHLLDNAAELTPEGGHIRLEFKRRSVHKYQFLVSNTGSVIPEEKREDIFKPFLEVRDLTQGDGLGLPICRQMAVKMGGDLSIDSEFTKGTRFVLSISA